MMASADIVVDLGATRLRCRVDGAEDAPWLVFSNSLMTDLTLWDDQVAAFGDRFRILRYDQRGHGLSAVPDGACRFPTLVADLMALLDRFAIARATAVGVSMGGVTVLGLAALHPDRVARVAVCDCQSGSSPAGATAWDERIALAAGSMDALVEPTLARWFRPTTLAAQHSALGRIRRMIAATPHQGFVHGARALQDYDFRAYPARLRCPAAFIVGAEDGALPPAMRAMAEEAPRSRFVAIDDAGHLPNIEQPAAFDAALSALLAIPERG